MQRLRLVPLGHKVILLLLLELLGRLVHLGQVPLEGGAHRGRAGVPCTPQRCRPPGLTRVPEQLQGLLVPPSPQQAEHGLQQPPLLRHVVRVQAPSLPGRGVRVQLGHQHAVAHGQPRLSPQAVAECKGPRRQGPRTELRLPDQLPIRQRLEPGHHLGTPSQLGARVHHLPDPLPQGLDAARAGHRQVLPQHRHVVLTALLAHGGAGQVGHGVVGQEPHQAPGGRLGLQGIRLLLEG